MQDVGFLLLAGGQSRRMGGGDKNQLHLDGKSVMQHVLDRVDRADAPTVINANGDPKRFDEYGLPVIRVANTGISAIIDANGIVLKNLPVNKSGYLDAFIPSRKQSTVYGEYGNLIFLSLILMSLLVAFLYKQISNRVRLATETN